MLYQAVEIQALTLTALVLTGLASPRPQHMHPAIPRVAPCIRGQVVSAACRKFSVVSTSQKLERRDMAATPENTEPSGESLGWYLLASQGLQLRPEEEPRRAYKLSIFFQFKGTPGLQGGVAQPLRMDGSVRRAETPGSCWLWSITLCGQQGTWVLIGLHCRVTGQKQTSPEQLWGTSVTARPSCAEVTRGLYVRVLWQIHPLMDCGFYLTPQQHLCLALPAWQPLCVVLMDVCLIFSASQEFFEGVHLFA